LGIRALMQRSRRRLLVVLLVLGVGASVAVHHGMPEGIPMAGAHADHVTAICLGVIAAGTAVAVIAIGARRRRRRRAHLGAAPILRLAVALAFRPPVVRARAGPPPLLFLRLGVLQR